MKLLRRAIPSPGNLLIFEAAARLGSFTRAAEDLGMTQAAVSYGIRGLERSLGVALFIRDHRMVRLTEVGHRFFHDVSIGLSHIQQSVATIQRLQADRHVTLSVSTAFASLWMLPRLALFRAAHPDIDLRFLATDRDVDIGKENIALGIRRGEGKLAGCESAFFAPEIIYPICSSRYLQDLSRRAQDLAVADLPRLKLIHLEEPFRYRPTWSEWFAAQGHRFLDSGEGLCLNDYALVVQAALEGQGVALGWAHLIDDLVARGALVRLTDAAWETGSAFWIAWAGALAPEAQRVRDWLMDPATHRSLAPDAGSIASAAASG
jgi:DNA-binding transcriptional LysR family regulator